MPTASLAEDNQSKSTINNHRHRITYKYTYFSTSWLTYLISQAHLLRLAKSVIRFGRLITKDQGLILFIIYNKTTMVQVGHSNFTNSIKFHFCIPICCNLQNLVPDHHLKSENHMNSTPSSLFYLFSINHFLPYKKKWETKNHNQIKIKGLEKCGSSKACLKRL
jgi:hypothetical protein